MNTESSCHEKDPFHAKLLGKYPKNITFCPFFVWSAFLSKSKLSVLNNHQALCCLLMLMGSSNSWECLPFICSQNHQTQGRQSRLSKLALISRRLGHIKAISNNDLAGGLSILNQMKNMLCLKPQNLAGRLRIC